MLVETPYTFKAQRQPLKLRGLAANLGSVGPPHDGLLGRLQIQAARGPHRARCAELSSLGFWAFPGSGTVYDEVNAQGNVR